MLSTRLPTVADLWFYSTPSRYEDIPLDLQRCCGLHQTSSINELMEICFIFRGECEMCKPNTHCELISESQCEVISTFLFSPPSIKVQDLATVILVIKLWNTSFKLLLNVWKPHVKNDLTSVKWRRKVVPRSIFQLRQTGLKTGRAACNQSSAASYLRIDSEKTSKLLWITDVCVCSFHLRLTDIKKRKCRCTIFL